MATANKAELKAVADQVERELMEVANGKRKPGKLSIEPIIRLVQYARTGTLHPAKVSG